MFAPWRSQKSVRKRKDPITDNSFIKEYKSFLAACSVLRNIEPSVILAPCQRYGRQITSRRLD